MVGVVDRCLKSICLIITSSFKSHEDGSHSVEVEARLSFYADA